VLNKLYWVQGVATIAFYMVTVAMGWEFFAPEREVVTRDARHGASYLSPGYRGGK
jgi:hypothetical protein